MPSRLAYLSLLLRRCSGSAGFSKQHTLLSVSVSSTSTSTQVTRFALLQFSPRTSVCLLSGALFGYTHQRFIDPKRRQINKVESERGPVRRKERERVDELWKSTIQNMREEGPESSHGNTILPLTSYNHDSLDLTSCKKSARHPSMAATARRTRGSSNGRSRNFNARTALLSALAIAPGAMAQSCISLSGSKQCPAFGSASISTDSTLVGFLYASPTVYARHAHTY